MYAAGNHLIIAPNLGCFSCFFYFFYFPFITLIKWWRFAALVTQALLKLHFHSADGFYLQNFPNKLSAWRDAAMTERLWHSWHLRRWPRVAALWRALSLLRVMEGNHLLMLHTGCHGFFNVLTSFVKHESKPVWGFLPHKESQCLNFPFGMIYFLHLDISSPSSSFPQR